MSALNIQVSSPEWRFWAGHVAHCDLINQVKTSARPNYCVRVTADDGAIGDQHLRDFQDNAKTIPTILTTSQKLSTGVDALNVRNIVLTRHDRADAVKGESFAEIQSDLKELLISILDAYERNGEDELSTTKLGQFLTARYGSVGEAKKRLGSLTQVKAAFHQMQARLYSY